MPGGGRPLPLSPSSTAYDKNSNVPYKKNMLPGANPGAPGYHANGVATSSSYDKLNRVLRFARGTLSSSGNDRSIQNGMAAFSGVHAM